MRNSFKERSALFSVRLSSLPRIVRGLYRLRRICEWEKVYDCLGTRCTSGSSPTGTRVFIQRAETRTRFTRSSRMAGEFGDLTPFRPLGKWQIRERQTISLPFVSRELTFESIRSRFQGSVPRRGPLTRDNTASTKESHLRYYIRTRIIQEQIWVLNEVKFARAVFMEPRIHWFGESDTSTYSPIYDNDDNGNINFKCSKMRS